VELRTRIKRERLLVKLHGKHYRLEYDETLLEVEVTALFDDQVILVLRKCEESTS
jgi:hypothetical protein